MLLEKCDFLGYYLRLTTVFFVKLPLTKEHTTYDLLFHLINNIQHITYFVRRSISQNTRFRDFLFLNNHIYILLLFFPFTRTLNICSISVIAIHNILGFANYVCYHPCSDIS